MKYYRLHIDEHFQKFEDVPKAMKPIHDECIRFGRPVSAKWQPFKFRFENRKKAFSDFPFLDTLFFAMSEKAFSLLHNTIAPFVEIFPLDIENIESQFYGINVTKVHNVDLNRSDIGGWPGRDKSGNKIFTVSDVYSFAFPEDQLPEASIFRTTYASNVGHVYLSEKFLDIVDNNKLTGLLFDWEMKYKTGPEKGTCTSYSNKLIEFNPDNLPIV